MGIEDKRFSNIESLRVMTIFLIIMCHIVCHCVNNQLSDVTSAFYLDNYFNKPYFEKKLIILYVINTFGTAGNSIFILISGYFLVKKENVDLAKISKKLLFQLGFAVIILTLLSLFFYSFKKNSYISLINIDYFNGMSWFIGYYYIIVLIGALVLNRYLRMIPKEHYKLLLIVILTIVQLSWSAGIVEGVIPGFRTLATGIFMYALGGYICLYDPFSRVNRIAIICIILICYSLIILSAYSIVQNRIEDYVREGSSGDFIQVIPGYGNHALVIWIISICVFELFRRINMKYLKSINFLGRATLMIYLLHDNSFIYSIWGIYDWIQLLNKSLVLFTLGLILCTIVTFLCGTIGYVIYLLIYRIIMRYMHMIF